MNKIDEIVDILQNHEFDLSDGYCYYCEPSVTLEEIAKEIMKL